MDEKLFSLHRYLLHANHTRKQFLTTLAGEPSDAEREMLLDLWYGCLYVVLEGWHELDLHDPEIDAHINDGDGPRFVDALRRHRNGVFHYQQRYWDERRLGPTGAGAESALWVRTLHDLLDAWFLRSFDEHWAARGGRPADG